LRVGTFTIDGEAVVCGPDGVADALHGERRLREAFLYAFDLLEVDGQDLRLHPFNERKRWLAKFLRGCPGGIAINEHVEADGAAVFAAACCHCISLMRLSK
jgi:bifunctional non-homologous end joining protein LigD